MQRIVLAYSGGLKSSVAVPWLADTHRAEIVTVTLDLGKGRDLEVVRDRALAIGAVRAHVLDVRDEFAKEFFLRALNAGVAYHPDRAVGPALTRPIIARKLVEIAAIERATIVAHACAAPDARIDTAVAALQPGIQIAAPARDWPFTPDGLAAYACERRMPLAGVRDSEVSAGNGAHKTAAGHRPAEPAYVEVTFRRGTPIAVNGVAMPLLDLLGSLDIIAGAHGVGRTERPETPGTAVLHAAHAELHRAVNGDTPDAALTQIAREYAELLDTGSWFTPRRETLDAELDPLRQRVSGTVRLKLFTGACDIVATMPGESLLKTDEYSVVRPVRFRA
jgi:argininosuccinate synthase